jgi:hypothetical protein
MILGGGKKIMSIKMGRHYMKGYMVMGYWTAGNTFLFYLLYGR